VVKIITQSVPGTLVVDGEKAALLLGDPEGGALVFLAYALVTQGPEHQILPATLLDDWGNEIGDLELYHWIHENGPRFPRAEVFGYSPAGGQAQYFLRDLELFTKYPVYAFAGHDDSVNSGVLLRAILVPDTRQADAHPIDPPENVTPLLREARVAWWRVGPERVDLGFLE
jgi:hypothetical protein